MTPADTALLVCISILQVLTALKLLTVLAQCAFPIWKASRWKSCGELCQWIRQWVWPLERKEVVEKFHSMQCQLLIKALQVTMFMSCIRFAFAQTFLFAGEQPRVYPLDLALVAVHVISLILTQFPTLVRPWCLNLWYLLLQGLLVAPFSMVGKRDVIALSNWTFVLRVMLALSARQGFLVLLGNAVPSFLVMQLVGFNTPRHSALFTGEVTKLTFLLLAVFSIRQLIYRDAKASVELKSRSIELDAVSSLLRSFCDAVIEVDQSLHMTEDSRQLLTILLRSSNQACLAGQDFLELFCMDDRSQVQECLTTASQTHAHALNARLLDADGNHVKVELLHVQFVTAAGDFHRLVGVREYQEVNDVAVKSLPQSSLGLCDSDTIGGTTVGTPALVFDIASFTILEANESLRKLALKCTGVQVNMPNVRLWDLSPQLGFERLSGQIQDLVNSQHCSTLESVSADMWLGEMLLGNTKVMVRISVRYNPVLENLAGCLFLYPAHTAGIPLTQANIDRLEQFGNGKRRRSVRSRRSYSTGASSSSGSILDLHPKVSL